MDSVYNNLYFEIYALMSLDFAYPWYSQYMFKSERPDWQNDVSNIGLEITQATNKHLGYTRAFTNKYLGKNRAEIPDKEINSFWGELFFDDKDKLFATSDSRGLVEGTRHIALAINSVGNKLQLLNSPHFHRFSENELYLFFGNSIIDDDIDKFIAQYAIIEKDYPHKYSRLYLFDNNAIYTVSTKNDSIEKYTFTNSELVKLKQNSQLLCAVHTWRDGDSYEEVKQTVPIC